MPAVNQPPTDPADRLHGAFRPRRGRRTAVGLGLAQGVVFVSIALLGPAEAGFRAFDRFGIIAVSAAIGTMLWRLARLALFADDAGLTVRNLGGDRRLEWAQVVTVRFGGGHPWVCLDLADGETLAVMAVQRADGAFAESEARRLATLVALHSQTERDD
jgi:hypothetical protein